MDLKTVFRAASMALAVGVSTAALVACGGGASSEIPTTVASSAETIATLDSSDLTTSDDATTTATPPDGRPQGPPEEALAACEGQSAEVACSFASPRDGSTVDGTCHERRDNPSQYVCFPSDWDGHGGRGQGPQGPPEGALAACEGMATGTACSFEAPFGTVEGTCSAGLGGSGQVACRPEWADGEGPFGPGGPGREGQGPQQATAACEGLEVDTACSFESPFGPVSGACRNGRDGSTLVCAPSNWPPR